MNNTIKLVSFSSAVLIFILFLGCALTYKLSNKDKLQSDRIAIEKLNNLFENRPLEFLEEIKIDTNYFAHEIIPLGFSYRYESGGFRYNDQIYFWCKIIRLDDSIISFSATPFAWSLGPSGWAAYSSIFEEYGWRKKGRFSNQFVDRIYNYQSTVKPITSHSIVKPNNITLIDSIMSPHYGVIYQEGPTQSYHEQIVNSIAHDDATIYYLLHSLNPVTRMLAIRNAKFLDINITESTRKRIQYLLESSPKLRTKYGSIVNSSDLQSLVDCNRNIF